MTFTPMRQENAPAAEAEEGFSAWERPRKWCRHRRLHRCSREKSQLQLPSNACFRLRSKNGEGNFALAGSFLSDVFVRTQSAGRIAPGGGHRLKSKTAAD